MNPLPHHYTVLSHAAAEGSVALSARRLPTLQSAPPAEFGGPGDQWSPETLLMAAVADCFILTFRAIARASKLEWQALDCRAEGTLDRVEQITRFVSIRLQADLMLEPGRDRESARRLLEKAEKACLISNSLDLKVELHANVKTA